MRPTYTDEQAAREADPITILTRRIEAIEARIAAIEKGRDR